MGHGQLSAVACDQAEVVSPVQPLICPAILGTDVCLLCVATSPICPIAGNALAGRAGMMTFTSVTSSYDWHLGYLSIPITSCNESSLTTGAVARRIVHHLYPRVSSDGRARMILGSFVSALLHLNSCLLIDSFILRVVSVCSLSLIHALSFALST